MTDRRSLLPLKHLKEKQHKNGTKHTSVSHNGKANTFNSRELGQQRVRH